jgi:hypothetical protein
MKTKDMIERTNKSQGWGKGTQCPVKSMGSADPE